MRRVLAVVLSLYMVGTMAAFAQTSVYKNDTCTENLTWVFDPSGGTADDFGLAGHIACNVQI